MSSGDAAQLDDEFARLSASPSPIRDVLRRASRAGALYRTPFDFWYVTRYDLAVAISRDNTGWTVSGP